MYYYITTPIYYVNDIPHIGHAYTTIASDVIARYMRLSGKKVKFLTGTDEHGQKIQRSAEKASIETQAFVDQNALKFKELADVLNCSHDDFIRTTEARHKRAVAHLWNVLSSNGDIYLGSYSGWYSVRDEAFYDESEIVDGLAPTGAPVEWLEEESYFFALSKWQDKLLEFYEKNPNFILPLSRRNEIINFVKQGLKDLSVSRKTCSWGIKVPGNDSHSIYVWLDALTNYISALGYPENGEEFTNFWPANVHIVGKDITRFHAIYWPAFLMSAGIESPQCIMAHGWWTNEGQKISKSLGNTIDPLTLVEEFGVDQVRYFLMREVTFGNDGNYSRASMINRINSELSNKIGNLVQRTLSFVHKNCEIMPQKYSDFEDNHIVKFAKSLQNRFDIAISKYDINDILDGINELADMGNSYIDKEAPWALKKTDLERMNQVLYILLYVIRHIGIYLQPFTPTAASKILDQLSININNRNFEDLQYNFEPKTIDLPNPIFARHI